MPPPYPGDLYTPESFGPPPPEEQFGDQEYDQWHARYQEWVADLSALCHSVIPEEVHGSKYPVSSGWGLFLSMCVLFDPPEPQLKDFAEAITWEYSNVILRGRYTMYLRDIAWAPDAIVWLTDADRAEGAIREFYEELLVVLLEKYVHPQGISSEDALRTIHGERPELLKRLMQRICDNESRPYIDVKPHHRREEIESAIQMLMARHEVRPAKGRRKRDEFTAVQCAILYDRHNGKDADDRRRWKWSYEKLAEKFGLDSWRAAKEYVLLGRELLETK